MHRLQGILRQKSRQVRFKSRRTKLCLKLEYGKVQAQQITF